MQKYSMDDLFKNEQAENNQHIEQTEEQANEPTEEESLVEYKEENIFIKIINKIKNFLKAK